MRLILVGETNAGSRTPQRLRALRELGHDVVMVPTTPPDWSYESKPSLWQRLRYRLRLPADPAGANRAVLRAAMAGCDAAIFDNARMIHPATLRRLAPLCKLIWYSEDDTMNPIHRTRWMNASIPLYNLWVTTKSFNIAPNEVPSLGARQMLFVNNSFCPHAHAPLEINDHDRQFWGSPISFVGTFETQRAADLLALAEAGLNVRVWGNGWQSMIGSHSNLRIENRPVYGDEYRKVVAASLLNCCFLRKGNRDLQTCRSIELPAMAAAMAHEASPEVESLFMPDREAVYFSDRKSLVVAARRWLSNPDGLRLMGQAAHQRAWNDGHDHQRRWQFILSQALENKCAS